MICGVRPFLVVEQYLGMLARNGTQEATPKGVTKIGKLMCSMCLMGWTGRWPATSSDFVDCPFCKCNAGVPVEHLHEVRYKEGVE